MSVVSTVANRTADAIERFGHFQQPAHNIASANSDMSPTGLCCIFANPVPRQVDSRDWSLFEDALRDRLRDDLGPEHPAVNPFSQWVSIVDWNDDTPTSEVIATLRSL